MATIRLYEDNAGGLHMTDGKDIIRGFEYRPTPGGMFADMVLWAKAGQWPTGAEAASAYDGNPPGELIADCDETFVTVHYQRLGIAGARYANLNIEE